MKKIYTLLLAAFVFTGANAQVILAQWNFNSVPPDASTSTGSSTVSTGAGTLTTIGGVTSTFASGFSGVSSSDPAASDNTALNLSGFPAQSTGDKTAGIQIQVNTTGFSGLSLNFDSRNSGTAANELIVQYSTDGVSFTDAPGGTFTFSNTSFTNNQTVNLAAITALDNQPAVYLRIVSSFTGSGTTYTGTTGAYGTTGTTRFDMVTVRYLAIVPIACSFFDASLKNDQVAVNWTASCTNTQSYFEVEKSADGRNFSPISKTAAAQGNQQYVYTDLKPTRGNSYYRLRMVDIDGKSYYTNVARVNYRSQSLAINNIYPSLASTQVIVQINSNSNQTTALHILDMNGRIVKTMPLKLLAGDQALPVDISALLPGAYTVRLQTGSETVTARFIRQ
jgi:Secretion system C-terminal sorting domain